MGASVRFDNLDDPRYVALGILMGSNEFDAIGRLGKLYQYCTDRQTYVIPKLMIHAITRIENFDQLLIKSELGEEVSDGIRIKGTRGRIEWLRKLRQNGRKGGRPAKPKRNQNETKQEPPSNPLTLTPTITITNNTKDPSGGAAPLALTPKKVSRGNSNSPEFIAAMVRAYQSRYRVRPVLDGATQGQIKRLLTAIPVQSAIEMYQVYLQLDDDWFKKKRHDFATFMANLQTVAVALGTGEKTTSVNWGDVLGDAGSLQIADATPN